MSRRNNKKRAAVQRASMPSLPQQQGGNMMVIPQSMLQAILMQQSPQKATPGESMLPGAPLVPYKGIIPKSGPRIFSYPVGYNIGYLSRAMQPDQQTIPTFQQLRNFARSYDGFQLCLRVWLDLIMKLKLQIKPRPDLIEDGDDEDDAKWQKEAKPYYEFFEKPDKQLDLHQWLRKAITDQLEIDALCIYMRPTRGGGLYSMDLIEGNTIKPLLDDRGRPPDPPYPAYQQYLYAGLPGPLLTSQQLVYIRESPRTDTPYGISRVERIVTRVQQALRKQSKDLAMFTDGNIPPGLLQLPQTDSDWTSDEVQAYQQMFDSLLAGNDQQRSRIRVVPPGTTYAPLDDMEMTTEFDKFLLNVTVAAMGLSMADLGFTEDVNRSSGDSQENMTYRRTMQPLMNMYAALFTRVLRDYFDENRFVVTWGGFEESEDLEMQANAYSSLVQHGIISPSDAARAMHQPVHFEIGPIVETKDGLILLEDFADPTFRAAQKQARLSALQMAANPPQPQSTSQDGQEKGKQSIQQAKKQEEDESNDEAQQSEAKRVAIGEPVPIFQEQEQAQATGQIHSSDVERSGEVQHPAQITHGKNHAAASNGAEDNDEQCHTGMMVAFMLDPHTAEQLALPDSEPAQDLHVTLAILGDINEPSIGALHPAQTLDTIKTGLFTFASNTQPLQGYVGGIGRFINPDQDVTPIVAMVNAPGLADWRQRLVEMLEVMGYGVAHDFDYLPHITLAYVPATASMPVDDIPRLPLKFDTICLAIGDDRYFFPIGQAPDNRSVSAEYRRWRQRAIDDVKEGRSQRPFTTTLIPDYLHATISDMLEECATIESVKAVFQRARSVEAFDDWQQYEPTTAKAIAKLRARGVKAIRWNARCECEHCTSMHGEVRTVGTAFSNGSYLPPSHDGCGCDYEEVDVEFAPYSGGVTDKEKSRA